MKKMLSEIEKIGKHDHLCLIYHNQEEQFASVIPYVRIGLERNERCLYITDDHTKKKVIREMKKGGINVDTAVKKGAIIFVTINDSYLRGGLFDPDALIKNVFIKAVKETEREGYISLRIVGDMTWTLGNKPGTERLIEYEAKLNYFFPKYNASGICQYNQKVFPAKIIKDIIYTHPIVIYNGSVSKNFHYILPKDFLEKKSDTEKVRQLLKNIKLTEEAQEQRDQAKKQLETVLMQLPAAVIVADALTKRLIISNDQVDVIWRKPFSKLNKIGEYGAYKGFHADGREYISAEWPLSRTIKSGEVIKNEEIKILRGDGTYGYVNNNAAPIRNDEGKIIAGVVTFNDITDKVEQQRQKDEFMGIVSHELKTPVTSLKAYAQVLQSRFIKAGDDKSAAHLGKMDAQINKLTVLIEDLLDVTKIDAGKLQFHNSDFAFDSLIDEVSEEIQLTTHKHMISRKGKTDKVVYGDRERIGQVLANFLTNAIKYSPFGDKIIVETLIEEGSVVCSVRDFGVGIAKELHDRIFERFYRVTGDEELTYPGLGLGLYISSEIIERQGGRIWFESKKGKGSTFYFSLPLSKRRKIKQQKNTTVIDEMEHE